MAKIDFGWTYTDAKHPDVHFKLYENGKPIVDDIAALEFSLLMDGKAKGDYAYSVAAVDNKTHLESAQSASIVINFQLPAAPTGFKGSWAE